MYARTVGDRELNFAVSGKLWNRSLVMSDQETGTLWSHLLGQAMDGELKDSKLEMIPSQMTDWKTWVTQYPDTTVVNLSRTSQEYRRDFYKDPALFVLGIRAGLKTKAWTFDQLASERVVNDTLGGLPVVIFFDPASLTALAFERRLGGKVLQFRSTDMGIVDDQFDSNWDGLKGMPIGDGGEDKRLKPIPGIVSGLVPWITFHPDTEGLSESAVSHAKENSFLRRRRGPRRR